MSDSKSPLTRSIGTDGVIRWLVTVVAVLAIGAAFHEGHYGLGIAGVVFVLAAVMLALKAWRARQDAGADRSPLDGP
jgi:drug/metabolite transporter (DMT)-like permease